MMVQVGMRCSLNMPSLRGSDIRGPVVALAAIIKYHRLSGLNKRHLCLPIPEAVKYKTKVPADLVPGESPLPGLQMATFSLSTHMAEKALCLPSLAGTLSHLEPHPKDLI